MTKQSGVLVAVNRTFCTVNMNGSSSYLLIDELLSLEWSSRILGCLSVYAPKKQSVRQNKHKSVSRCNLQLVYFFGMLEAIDTASIYQ